MRADRIALALSAGRLVTERLDAVGQVSLKVGDRTASGERIVYLARDERYELTGSARHPASLGESCHAITGKTLIFYRSADRILVDGNEELRTQTKGGGSCGAATR